MNIYAQSPVVEFRTSEASVDERDGTYAIEVSVVNPNANPTSVEVYVTQNTATPGTDYNFSSPQTVTFPANSNKTQSVLVTILNNTTTDATRTVEFRLRNTTNDPDIGLDSALLLTIIDDDLAVTQSRISRSTMLIIVQPPSTRESEFREWFTASTFVLPVCNSL